MIYLFSIHLFPDSQYLFVFIYKSCQWTWTQLLQGFLKGPTMYVLQCIGLWKICTWWVGVLSSNMLRICWLSSPSKEWLLIVISGSVTLLLWIALRPVMMRDAPSTVQRTVEIPKAFGGFKGCFILSTSFGLLDNTQLFHLYVTGTVDFASDLLVQKHRSHCHPVKAFPLWCLSCLVGLRSVAAVATMNEKSSPIVLAHDRYSFCATYFEYSCYTTNVDCPKVRKWSKGFVQSCLSVIR